MLSMFVELIPTGILQGAVLSIITLGIYIPFRFLNFPDLTAEGSFPLGGVLCASLFVAGVDPALAMILAVVCSGCVGIGTALVHIYLKVNTLLAGIILTTMVYSINLKLMGKPNLALFNYPTIFTSFGETTFLKSFVIFCLIGILVIGLFLFLKTEKGLRFRAVGLNPLFSQRQGINLKGFMILGLFSGNALAGLAGSLLVQIQGYADIGMGVGIVIHALAALMIGESLIRSKNLMGQVISPVLGALIYQQIQGLALILGLEPSDLKLFTGLIVLGVIAMRGSLYKEKSFS